MKVSYINSLLKSHQAWIESGLNLEDIIQVHSELKDQDPFRNYGFNQINRRLGLSLSSSFNPEEITYLFIDDTEFDGDFNVFVDLKNLRAININGTGIGTKISDVGPLINNMKLTSLNLRNNSISSIEPLLQLPELEQLNIKENPVGNLELLAKFKKLKYLGFVDLDETLVSRILTNNQHCLIEFCDREIGDCYQAFNIESYPAKVTSYNVEETPNLIIEVTFLEKKQLPVEMERVFKDKRIYNLLCEGYQSKFDSFDIYENRMFLSYKKKGERYSI